LWHEVDLLSTASKSKSIARWKEFCDRGEGFVYKPAEFLNYTENYYPIQPALKVRGREYLRIIYGIDYLEPEYFDRLKARGTRRKRVLAIQEHELGMKILLSFLRRNKTMTEKFVAAFIGMETANMANIDATL
jgi:protein phosphatase